MKLKKLIKDIPFKDIKGSKDVEITGLSVNSKLVAPGHLFVAKKGHNDDGTKYIPEAIQGGAVAIVTDLYDPSLPITQLIDADVSSKEVELATHFYQFPSKELNVIGITGTNGKTTTSFLVKYLLDKVGDSAGLIGTIEYIIGNLRFSATRTTPDVISNHKMLRDMITHGCKSAVMEVTSHALDQNRVKGIEFDVAVFTNLTWEHLDYHGSMEEYAKAKAKLFQGLKPEAYACVNSDSPYAQAMLEKCKAKTIRFGLFSDCDLKAKDIVLTESGTRFHLDYQGKSYPVEIPHVGRFNIYNVLAALSALIASGYKLEALIPLLKNAPTVKGRIEPVPNPLNLKIFVDFAHKEEALINVLECLSEFKNGRILTVFGCGGDRDRGKRPKMAAAAEQFSDIVIVTNDNPRSEDPEAIAREIARGFKKDSYLIELDRRMAIKKAVMLAMPDDIILIAGKGHETYQIFQHKTCEFDDCKVALEVVLETMEERLVQA